MKAKKYNDFINEDQVDEMEIMENLIQNVKSDEFDGSDPNTIEVWNQGIGGTRSLQLHRKQIVKLLEKMLDEAKSAEKSHKNAYYSIDNILSLADESRLGGVFMKYLKNHQEAVMELESLRKRGGSGKGKTVPRGLI